MSSLIVQGSARNDGNTSKMAKFTAEQLNCELVNLLSLDIRPFDYLHKNSKDDFIPLIDQFVRQHTTLILASPVYWYTMSGAMKNFFDRFTDLLTVEKDLGRQLRGKNMLVIANSASAEAPPSFWPPFQQTADYLGMNYLGGFHSHYEAEYREELKQFLKKAKG